MGKFQTTSSTLYNKNDVSVMPEWMQTFTDNLQYKEKEKLNISFDKKGSFADTTSVNRPDADATPRDIIAELNTDKLIIGSKIELAKFLIGKYYKTNVKVDGNTARLNTTVDGLQANFVFEYNFQNGKIIQGSTFTINDAEYPFSKAGFNESLVDLKKGTIKKSTQKIASSRQTFVINREEIIRRFNGHLREATEVINQHVSEGILVGAGSNSYATYYDPEELFPRMEKEIPQLPTGSFEFVENTEHVATSEYKSARNLALEANKIIGNLFSDYTVNNSQRDNDELLVDATIVNSSGIRHKVNFNFTIENEKIGTLRIAEVNDQRMTVEQLINKFNVNNNLVEEYLKTATASKRIIGGIVLTQRELKDKLSPIVGSNKVDDFISAWLSNGSISPINSTTYISKNSIEELLGMIECESLTTEEKQSVANYKKSFGAGMDFDRIEQKDFGNREVDEAELSNEQKLTKINNELTKSFKNYQIEKFDNNIIFAQFVNDGVRHTIKIESIFNGRKLEKLNALINGDVVNINQLKKAFKTNPLLSNYLQSENANNFSTNIIASESNLLERLSKLTSEPENILNAWKQNYLKNISADLYSSQYSFEELLNKTDAILLSDEDKKQILIAKQYFGTAFERIAEQDNGIRDVENRVNSTTMHCEANDYLSQHFANYRAGKFLMRKENLCSYDIDLFDESTGLSNNVNFILGYKNGKVSECKAALEGNLVSIENVKKAFAMNEILTEYLQTTSGKKFNAPMIISKGDLYRRLASITNTEKEEIENVIEVWQEQGKLDQIDQNTFASKLSLEQLISTSDIKALSVEDKKQILMAKQHFGETLRRIEQEDNGTRDVENRVNYETMLYEANNYLSQHFANYKPTNFIFHNENLCSYNIDLFDENTGISNNINFELGYKTGKIIECNTLLKGNLVSIENVKKAFAMNEILSKYLQVNSGKKFNAPMVISTEDLHRRLSSITNAGKEEIENVIETWQKYGKINRLSQNTFASKLSLEQLISMSNIKPLTDIEIVAKIDKSRRDKGMSITSNHISDNDTRQPLETWSSEQMTLHGRTTIGTMFADFDIIDADLNNNDYTITARIINPINGLKQSLNFKFSTLNGTKLGEIDSINNGVISVDPKHILDLLESNIEAVNKFVSLNSISNKQHKNIISKTNLKNKLSSLINANDYDSIVDSLIIASIINPIDNNNFASEYSFPELIEYLSNSNKLDLKTAENNLKTYSKDIYVDTNIKHAKETDFRTLEKKAEVLSPKMVETSNKMRVLVASARENKKITFDKCVQLTSMLNCSNNPNDIENVWRELKKYL